MASADAQDDAEADASASEAVASSSTGASLTVMSAEAVGDRSLVSSPPSSAGGAPEGRAPVVEAEPEDSSTQGAQVFVKKEFDREEAEGIGTEPKSISPGLPEEPLAKVKKEHLTEDEHQELEYLLKAYDTTVKNTRKGPTRQLFNPYKPIERYKNCNRIFRFAATRRPKDKRTMLWILRSIRHHELGPKVPHHTFDESIRSHFAETEYVTAQIPTRVPDEVQVQPCKLSDDDEVSDLVDLSGEEVAEHRGRVFPQMLLKAEVAEQKSQTDEVAPVLADRFRDILDGGGPSGPAAAIHNNPGDAQAGVPDEVTREMLVQFYAKHDPTKVDKVAWPRS